MSGKKSFKYDEEFYNEIKRIERKVEITFIIFGFVILVIAGLIVSWVCYNPMNEYLKLICGVF